MPVKPGGLRYPWTPENARRINIVIVNLKNRSFELKISHPAKFSHRVIPEGGSTFKRQREIQHLLKKLHACTGYPFSKIHEVPGHFIVYGRREGPGNCAWEKTPDYRRTDPLD